MSEKLSTRFPKWSVTGASIASVFLFSAAAYFAPHARAQTSNASPGAQTSAPSATAPSGTVPDISGFWEPRADGRGRGTPPKLTPEAAARQQEYRQRQQSGQAGPSGQAGVTDVARWCRALAFPFYLTSSPPWDIVVGPQEIIVLAERQEGSRHIYMDGRSHPDAAHLVISANGDSIGHWGGDTLVVDTIGLKGGIDTTGTYRGPHQHIVERYKLLDDGRLQVTMTWEDPDEYVEPYTTVRTYHKSPPNMRAMEDWCDASDELQWRSDAAPIAPPKKGSN